MKHSVYIGIGASAGGLESLKNLLPHLPQDQAYIYIIAQHSSPDKQSTLNQILAAYTDMQVEFIVHKHHFRPNTINIIPPGHNLITKNSLLFLEKSTDEPYLPTPSVDKLFSALSDLITSYSVGIILSGTGHDGVLGIKKIKEKGGVTIAQSTAEALYSSMPQSAVESGFIDYILDSKEIGAELISIINKTPKPLLQIANLLREKEKFYIHKYKTDTIMRRLHKRMTGLKCQNIDNYLKYIQTHDQELHLLYQSLLIGVTDFFRDKESFDFLREMLLVYLRTKEENYEVRVWDIACSTGEETYSLAILIDTISKELDKKFNVKIFATDIDENAITTAKQGFYAAKSVENIDKETLKNYFYEVNDGYKIINSLRSQIVFTHHDILTDPPFINQDIIICRNLLIYVLQEAQEEIFTLFHYGLKDNGILFLGSSESTFSSKHYFNQISSEHKLYTKRKLVNPPKISSHYFSKHLNENTPKAKGYIQKNHKLNIEEKITKSIFDFFVQWSIVVDTNLDIIYKKGAMPFLSIPDGYMSTNIIDNLDKELRHPISKLLKQVFKTLKEQSTQFIEINLEEQNDFFVKATALPLQGTDKNPLILLYFQALDKNELHFNIENLSLEKQPSIINNLKNQLHELQEDNEELNNEIKISTENMQLLNEELQSSNEELQSSNEELETSNEELQSSNEELHLSIDNEQKLQKEFSRILNATRDGIIGLDLQGNHTFVNEAAIKMLGYSEDELIGHSGHQLWHHSKPDGTTFDVNECALHSHIEKGTQYNAEDVFYKKDGSSFDVAVSQNPIIKNKKILGAVISFHDISEKNRLKKEILHEQKLANLYMNTLGTIVVELDTKANIAMINDEGCNILKIKKSQAIGKNFINNFIPKDIQEDVKKVFASLIDTNETSILSYDNPIIDTENKEHLIHWKNSYLLDTDQKITGVITSGIDITKENILTKKLVEQENLYKLTFEEADIGIAHTTLEGEWIDVNEHLCKLLGYTKEEFHTFSVNDITYTDDTIQDMQMRKQLLAKKKSSYHTQKRYIHKNGNIIWVAVAVVLLRDKFNEPLYLLKIIRDISQLKLLMNQLEKEKEKSEKMIEFAPIPIFIYDEDGNILLINKSFTQALEYELQEIPTISDFIEKVFLTHENIQEIKDYYNNPTKNKNVKHIMYTKTNEKKVEILNAVELNSEDSTDKNIYMISMLDITAIQKKDELMLAQSRQAAMGDMLAMIAHQWRQPLSVISMVANNLQVDIELDGKINPEELSNLITTLNHQTQYLSQTIDDFRDFFKPDKEKEFITISEIIQRLQNLTQNALEDNAITLIVENKLNTQLYTYPNQLIQVLINIINNAKDALKENSIAEPYINISMKEEKEELLVEICDNGGGLDESIKDKLGEPYVTTKSKNGTGLGLYMSSIIMTKQLNGRLFWKTNDIGCCFSIALPMKEDE